MARLRLTSPLTLGPHPDSWTNYLIRAPATRRDRITTLIQSLEHGTPRIVLTPVMTLDEHGGVVINLTVTCETKEVESEKIFDSFWSTVVKRSALSFTERLGVAIEEELSDYDVDPDLDAGSCSQL